MPQYILFISVLFPSCFPNERIHVFGLPSDSFPFTILMNILVPLTVDNYLAMEVACTMVCPKENQEVIVLQPNGQETQKCEKCAEHCPKGVCACAQVHVFLKH